MNYQQIQDWKKVKTLDDAKQWHLKHTPYFEEKVIDRLVEQYPQLIKKKNIEMIHKESDAASEFIKYLWE